MGRLFCEHIKRNITCLDGAWSCIKDEKNIGEENKWYLGLPDKQTVMVPSVWNSELGELSYEGVMWYEKEFYFSGGCIRLVFDAVMTKADVWLDGEYLGSHYGGFSGFYFIKNNIIKGLHRLTIKVDNKFDSQSIPQKWVDWYHYGGIIRSVYAEEFKGICILNNRLDYELNEKLDSAECTLTYELYNAEDKTLTTPISIRLGNKALLAEEITLKSGEKVFLKNSFFIKDIELWDTDSPKLYTLEITTETDDLYDRIGFRKIEVKDQQIFLNNKSIELRGVNRHEEYPDFGFAFPKALMKRDLDIIKDLGCNTVRGSHYPNSQEFVDMMDERGILFWSEIPIWGCGFSKEAIGDSVVVERGLNMHREMIEQYFNHPSIIIWGMHNEIPSDCPAALDMTKTYYHYLKQEGGNRIVTYATDKPNIDICFEYCDVISINQYYGWYYGDKNSWGKFLENFRKRRDSLGLSHKPVIISEFGCAALYGEHTFDNIPWTEEYQSDLLEHSLNTFHNDSMVAGYYVWQFSDIRTCLEAGLNRARGFNNKGILNEYRKPKAAYYAVKNAYKSFIDEENDNGKIFE